MPESYISPAEPSDYPDTGSSTGQSQRLRGYEEYAQGMTHADLINAYAVSVERAEKAEAQAAEAEQRAAEAEQRAVEAEQRAVAAEERATLESKHKERLGELAVTDVLTGLLNRLGLAGKYDNLQLLRHWSDPNDINRRTTDIDSGSTPHHLTVPVDQLYSRIRPNHVVDTMLAIDVDFFKQLNDSAGHHAGDVYLQALAKTLREMTRPEDVLSRIGGDEFFVILADTSLPAAVEVARRFQEGASKFKEIEGHAVTASLSIGVGVVDTTAMLETNRIVADALLYQAKAQEGKGRIVVQSDDGPKVVADPS